MDTGLDRLVVHGDFGQTSGTKDPVLQEINKRWPVTLETDYPGFNSSPTNSVAYRHIFTLRQDTWGDYFSPKFCHIVVSPYLTSG